LLTGIKPPCQHATALAIDLDHGGFLPRPHPVPVEFGSPGGQPPLFAQLEELMKKTLAFTLLVAGTLGAVASAQAVDARARFMAANCAYCHGPDGKSRGAIPSLAGLEKGYFVEQMKAFRDGKREATVMQKHAMGYTDAEYEAMGAWFAAIK
jgi:sulfide dehydrogenase cytochrome subunit